MKLPFHIPICAVSQAWPAICMVRKVWKKGMFCDKVAVGLNLEQKPLLFLLQGDLAIKIRSGFLCFGKKRE